jgi:hypothetical protein
MLSVVRQLTILNGAALSDQISDPRLLGEAASVTIIGPAALTNVCKVEVGEKAAGTFGTMQNPSGTDVAIAAGKAVVLPPFGAGAIQIRSAGNEGADRVFQVIIQGYR